MPSDKGEFVLGVDLDGVCADFYGRMREIASEWLEVGLETLPMDVSYGLTEWGIRDEDHYRQLHRYAVTQRDFFETCAPIKGAATTLRAAGHYAICFANSANKGIAAPRARRWDEVYALIKERWPEPRVGGTEG